MRRKVAWYAATFCIFVAWLFYTQILASQETLRMVDRLHIDKAFHMAAGAWLAGFLVLALGLSRPRVMATVVFVGIAWEVFELIAFPHVTFFYQHFYWLWVSDTVGDIIVDILGGLMYFYFGYVLKKRNRKEGNNDSQPISRTL